MLSTKLWTLCTWICWQRPLPLSRKICSLCSLYESKYRIVHIICSKLFEKNLGESLRWLLQLSFEFCNGLRGLVLCTLRDLAASAVRSLEESRSFPKSKLFCILFSFKRTKLSLSFKNLRDKLLVYLVFFVKKIEHSHCRYVSSCIRLSAVMHLYAQVHTRICCFISAWHFFDTVQNGAFLLPCKQK